MITGWIDLIKKPFQESHDFVSVDARRSSASHNIKNYEMMTSPPSRASRVPRDTHEKSQPVAFSPSSEYEESISTFSPSSKTDYFGKEVQYVSPTLSFSTPRPPSAGRRARREWDPASTHAKPSATRPSRGWDDTSGKMYG